MKKKDLYLLLLILIVLLGALLRLFYIMHHSVWHDEATRISILKFRLDELSSAVRIRTSTPPLNYYLAYFWSRLIGHSDLSLRLYSFAFSMLSIPLFYLIGLRFLSRQAGLIASFLAAISPFYVYYSQEFSEYSLLLFLSLLSLYFFLSFIRRPLALTGLLYVLCSLLAFYTHYYAGVMFVVQNIFFLLLILLRRKRSGLKSWLLTQLALLLFCTPFISRLFFATSFYTASPRPPLINLFFSFGAFVFAYSYFKGITIIMIPFLIMALATYGLLYIHSLRFLRDSRVLFLNLHLFLSVLLAFAVSWLVHNYVLRGVIFASAGLYLLIGLALSRIRRPAVFIIALVMVSAVSAASLFHYYFIFQKEDWRSAAGYIEVNLQEYDTVMVYPGTLSGFYHYFPEKGCVRGIPLGYANDLDMLRQAANASVMDISRYNMDELVAMPLAERHSRRLWVVTGHQEYDPEDPLMSYVAERYQLVEQRDFSAVQVFLFDLDTSVI